MYQENGSKFKKIIPNILNRKTKGKKPRKEKKKYGKQKFKAISNIISYVFIKKMFFEFRLKQLKLKAFNCSSISFQIFWPKYLILNFP